MALRLLAFLNVLIKCVQLGEMHVMLLDLPAP